MTSAPIRRPWRNRGVIEESESARNGDGATPSDPSGHETRPQERGATQTSWLSLPVFVRCNPRLRGRESNPSDWSLSRPHKAALRITRPPRIVPARPSSRGSTRRRDSNPNHQVAHGRESTQGANPLPAGYKTYLWNKDKGAENLGKWADAAYAQAHS